MCIGIIAIEWLHVKRCASPARESEPYQHHVIWQNWVLTSARPYAILLNVVELIVLKVSPAQAGKSDNTVNRAGNFVISSSFPKLGPFGGASFLYSGVLPLLCMPDRPDYDGAMAIFHMHLTKSIEQLVGSECQILHVEFDPGSGRTLAACLMHASRTRHLSGW